MNKMPDCLTCASSIDGDNQSFEIQSNNEIQNALCKHFWFDEAQYRKSTICCPCWNKIEDFHRFYCKVEELHSKQILPHVQLVEIKQENVQYDFASEQPDVFMKAEEYEPFGINVKTLEENYPTTKHASLSDIGESSKRPRLNKDILDAVQEYVSQNLPLHCDTCSVRCITFDDLQRHSLMQHAKKATVMCCNTKLTNSYRFVDHIRFHLDPNEFKCSPCSKQFGSREALNRHVRSHTLGPASDLEYPMSDTGKDESVDAVGVDDERSDGDQGDDEPDGDVDYESESDDSEESHNSENDKKVKIDGEPVAKTDDQHDSRKTSVADNEKMIAENVNLECDSCQKKFSSFAALQKHSTAEHNKPAYVFCCSSKFNQKQRLVDHILFHLDPSRFQCKLCHKNFCQTKSLQRHMIKKHSPEDAKTFQCTMCPKKFTRQTFLNTHLRYHNRRWRCELCDKKFMCEGTLKVHHKSIHTKELSYVCHVCARTFHIYASYRSHLETHDESAKKKPQKPRVQCQICNTWTQKMSHHMRLHSGPRTCEICGKECRHAIAYRYHMKGHQLGDFVCSVCGKSFKRDNTLKEHMASHTGDVLYSCDFCDRTFNSSANRASHRKKMHPQQWLEDKLKKQAARREQSSEVDQP
ncbi:zinc finger protein 658B isoform X2 [Aedes albopictus]|uniref:C2H2-type domain-containing protein n=1 Tax=Aedes albopictus TaxID=7160 RepID=A0ABM1ZXC0_AEDAL